MTSPKSFKWKEYLHCGGVASELVQDYCNWNPEYFDLMLHKKVIEPKKLEELSHDYCYSNKQDMTFVYLADSTR